MSELCSVFVDLSQGVNKSTPLIFLEMVKDIRKGVVKARKGHDKIVILSLENEKYKTAFDNIVSSEKDKISESRSRALGGSLLERLRSGGAKYFFKQAGDEQKLSRDEILSRK